MVTKACYVGEGFTRKPPKFERFIRPMGLRYKKAHVTHPEVMIREKSLLHMTIFSSFTIKTAQALPHRGC